VGIVRLVRLGKPAPGRLSPAGPRTARVLTEIFGHGRFKNRPGVRIAHWVVMLSFPVLFISIITAFGQLIDPAWAIPGIGHWPPLEWLLEIFAWAGLIGGLALIYVRTRAGRERGSRFYGSDWWHARFVEAVIVGVVACVIALRIAEYAYLHNSGATDLATWVHFPLTAWAGSLLTGLSLTTLGWMITIIAALKLAISLAWFVVVGMIPSMGVAWHRFLAIVNVYARRHPDGRPALGAMDPLMVGDVPLTVETMEELPEDARLGVESLADLSWKNLLDTATCTECGRCQDLCPAWNTGKPLNPKLLVTGLREHAFASAPFARAASQIASDDADRPAPPVSHQGDVLGALMSAGGLEGAPEPGWDSPLVPNVVTPEVLWNCTTCGACVDQCPVDIEQLDLVYGLRRHQTLMESAFPAELGKMFTKMENKGNPWGANPRKRLEWAKDLDFDVPQVGVDVESADEVDYLFWVGCAGAFEDRAKRTTAAVAELLHTAGVTFAVLGDGETCTGDPARRAGNEVLFQMLAAQNVETLGEVGATRIVVTCAHCFNTLANEYPQIGGNYEVIHHTQLLNRLVREGRLTPVEPPPEERRTITFHDPCYLGRHNQVYSPPREILDGLPGAELREMEANRERAMCCGAGGAHAFMEDRSETKINVVRSQQAAATGAQVVATACPFCTTMLRDGGAATGADFEVKDVATLLLEGVRRGQN